MKLKTELWSRHKQSERNKACMVLIFFGISPVAERENELFLPSTGSFAGVRGEILKAVQKVPESHGTPNDSEIFPMHSLFPQ